MAILGVTMLNKNGYPLGSDPALVQSPVAQQAHDKLAASTNPYVLAVAGYQLSFQGAILRGSGKLAFDAGPLAESVLQRAVSLAPNDPDVASSCSSIARFNERSRRHAAESWVNKSVMSVLSALLDSMLPNRAFHQRVKTLSDPKSRLKYWTVRVVLFVLVLIALSFFGINQHRQLH